MKKLCFLIPLVLMGMVSMSQADTIPPYKRFPTIPPFKLLKIDSANYFTKNDLQKNRPVLIMLFNPECEHCKHETESILKNIDELKDVQIVMATMMTFDSMKAFYYKFGLQKYSNITVGQDTQYTLPTFYQIRFMPYLAMYDKKGKLLTTFEGAMKIDDLIHTFQ